jgi:hypothetical protein
MNAAQRGGELPGHVGERSGKRRPPPDQDVIVSGAKRGRWRKPHHFAQPPPHAIAFDRVADLTRHCETDARRSGRSALMRLQYERAGGSLRSALAAFGGGLGSSSKIRPPFQPFHEVLALASNIAGANGGNRAQAGAPELTR